MNWINDGVLPKIRSFLNKKDTPENLWVKCPESGEMVFYRDLEANQWVVPNSGYHMKIKARDRLGHFFDDAAFTEVEVPDVPVDPLKFRGIKRYTDQLRDARTKTSMKDSVLVADGKLFGRDLTAAVQDFDFMGGTLGMAAGSAVVAGLDRARERKTPFVLFAASGGARMQEGMLSLMQMPRTTVAVERFRETGLPYVVVFTNPTTGGVTASYAMLGDVHIAEPGALIGFAGPRVIENTIREKLPKGFQTAEYLREHGMVDMVVHRHNMRNVIGSLTGIFMKAPAIDEIGDKPANVVNMRDVVVAAEGDAEEDELLDNPPIGAHAE
ncbi:acetyl-CoA carboxylase, carboxyltransferase subunit beta [Cucumibacter marinus]|uniref:acetyl-CoA carboxylase, carboxyltransferase subunit beta n=1 Tax=Cucumibacter marinus TaxID=1121252 RepID=UPI0003FE4D62|nr:acetyl-CoA carboxylase, carboxyltransferase subunit beta [Cucumibacter marinus]